MKTKTENFSIIRDKRIMKSLEEKLEICHKYCQSYKKDYKSTKAIKYDEITKSFYVPYGMYFPFKMPLKTCAFLISFDQKKLSLRSGYGNTASCLYINSLDATNWEICINTIYSQLLNLFQADIHLKYKSKIEDKLNKIRSEMVNGLAEEEMKLL